MFQIKPNFREFERALTDMGRKQLPFATALALNDTAKDVQGDLGPYLERRLDNPTPFTKRGTFVQRASKRKLKAVVGFKDRQAEYLRFQTGGGVRHPRRRALVMPVNARVNRYGNLSRNAIKTLTRRKGVFVGKVRGFGGVWQRPNKRKARTQGPKLLIGFRSRASYAPRLDLHKVVKRRASVAFPKRMGQRLKHAFATAR